MKSLRNLFDVHFTEWTRFVCFAHGHLFCFGHLRGLVRETLLETCLRCRHLQRVRLSSLEFWEITEARDIFFLQNISTIIKPDNVCHQNWFNCPLATVIDSWATCANCSQNWVADNSDVVNQLELLNSMRKSRPMQFQSVAQKHTYHHISCARWVAGFAMFCFWHNCCAVRYVQTNTDANNTLFKRCAAKNGNQINRANLKLMFCRCSIFLRRATFEITGSATLWRSPAGLDSFSVFHCHSSILVLCIDIQQQFQTICCSLQCLGMFGWQSPRMLPTTTQSVPCLVRTLHICWLSGKCHWSLQCPFSCLWKIQSTMNLISLQTIRDTFCGYIPGCNGPLALECANNGSTAVGEDFCRQHSIFICQKFILVILRIQPCEIQTHKTCRIEMRFWFTFFGFSNQLCFLDNMETCPEVLEIQSVADLVSFIQELVEIHCWKNKLQHKSGEKFYLPTLKFLIISHTPTDPTQKFIFRLTAPSARMTFWDKAHETENYVSVSRGALRWHRNGTFRPDCSPTLLQPPPPHTHTHTHPLDAQTKKSRPKTTTEISRQTKFWVNVRMMDIVAMLSISLSNLMENNLKLFSFILVQRISNLP